MTSPRPRAVVLGSLSLFAVLFVVLALQLSASASTPAEKAKATTVASEPEVEYAEPEPEIEYVEPEVEEVPPVVTSSS
jgi:hypothetical protein